MELYGIKNALTREYKRLHADSTDHAKHLTGWNLNDILYTLQLTVGDKPMPGGTKKTLRERAEIKRAVRGSRKTNGTINATSDRADTHREREEIDMSKGTLEALKKSRGAKAVGKRGGGKGKAGKKPVAGPKLSVAKRLLADPKIALPEKFVKKFMGKEYRVEKSGDGWSLGNGAEATLREIKRAILDEHKDAKQHHSVRSFFAGAKAA